MLTKQFSTPSSSGLASVPLPGVISDDMLITITIVGPTLASSSRFHVRNLDIFLCAHKCFEHNC